VENRRQPLKLLHAEPLYIDLIRDLGARKGEQEWNIGLGLTDKTDYDNYTALVEYEWAPIDRLGLEVELPFTISAPLAKNGSAPGSRLNSVKLAGQYTFLVSGKAKTSLAFGYIHEFELPAFREYGKEKLHQGNVYNPFFIAAKRWGNNFHTLIYTGPVIRQHFGHPVHTTWQINSNVHYMMSGTRHFIGLEVNKEMHAGVMDMTLRPQMRLSVTDRLMIGVVSGVPLRRNTERISSFLRLIYEPGHHRKV
jgi:hypothetical protein